MSRSPLHLKVAEFANSLIDGVKHLHENPLTDASTAEELVHNKRTELQAAIDLHWLALENCRMLAQRCPSEAWAQNVLRFCASAGSVPTPLGR